MRVLYLDTLFFLNLTVDYLLLLLTARLSGRFVQRRRLLAGAAVGALLAVLLFFPRLPWLMSLGVKAGSCAATVLSAFGKRTARELSRLMGLFLLLTALLAGLLTALAAAEPALTVQNGSIYTEISMPVMLIGFTALFLLSAQILGKGRAAPERVWREIQAESPAGEAHFRALVDSGNLLRDPLSGRQVIVTESGAAAPLLGMEEEALLHMLNSLSGEALLLCLREQAGVPFWLLPARTVSEERLLAVFRPRRLLVDGRLREDCLLGLTGARLDIGGDCRALMGV